MATSSPDVAKEDVQSSHPRVSEVTETIRLLLRQGVVAADIVQPVIARQEQLYRDVDSLNEELQGIRKHLGSMNDNDRLELEMYCSKVIQCRSRVRAICHQLIVTKERLQRIQSFLLHAPEVCSVQNSAI